MSSDLEVRLVAGIPPYWPWGETQILHKWHWVPMALGKNSGLHGYCDIIDFIAARGETASVSHQ